LSNLTFATAAFETRGKSKLLLVWMMRLGIPEFTNYPLI